MKKFVAAAVLATLPLSIAAADGFMDPMPLPLDGPGGVATGVWWAECAGTLDAYGELAGASSNDASITQYYHEVGNSAALTALAMLMYKDMIALDMDRLRSKLDGRRLMVGEWRSTHYNMLSAMISTLELDEFTEKLAADITACDAQHEIGNQSIMMMRELVN